MLNYNFNSLNFLSLWFWCCWFLIDRLLYKIRDQILRLKYQNNEFEKWGRLKL